MSTTHTWSVTSYAIVAFLVALVIAIPMFAQQRRPVAISVDTPDNDADCPAFETG
jgi:hypothetical protein